MRECLKGAWLSVHAPKYDPSWGELLITPSFALVHRIESGLWSQLQGHSW